MNTYHVADKVSRDGVRLFGRCGHGPGPSDLGVQLVDEHGEPACPVCAPGEIRSGRARLADAGTIERLLAAAERRQAEAPRHPQTGAYRELVAPAELERWQVILRAHEERGSAEADQLLDGLEAVVRLGGERLERLRSVLSAAGF